MKKLCSLFRVSQNCRVFRSALGLAVAGFLIGSPPALRAQFDNFSDGNDTMNPTWTHLSGTVGSTGQTWDASTGEYRLTAPTNGLTGLGFVGSHVGAAYTDVRVSADFVSFLGPTGSGISNASTAFGVAARLNGVNTFGGLSGYMYWYEPDTADGLGEVVLIRLNSGIVITDIGSQQVTLDPSKDYRFVLEINGFNLHGQVYEIGGGLVAEKMATDIAYAAGFSGVVAYSKSPLPPVDFTIDNFLAEVPEPGLSLLMGLGAIGLLVGRLWRSRA